MKIYVKIEEYDDLLLDECFHSVDEALLAVAAFEYEYDAIQDANDE